MRNFIIMSMLTTCLNAFSQNYTVINQNVTHGTLGDTSPNGCVSVKFLVTYHSNDNVSYTVSSSTVGLDKNNTTTLSATIIPTGKLIVIESKKIVVICTNGSYTYTLTNSAVNNFDSLGFNHCSSSTTNYINNVETISPSLYTFMITGAGG